MTEEWTPPDTPLEPFTGWRPHPGPQERYLRNPAFEVLYGGAKGGGKSDCLLAGACAQIEIPGRRALILRATFPQLRELMDRAHVLYRGFGLKWEASNKRWKHPVSGSTIEFGYCQTFEEAQQYAGQEFQYIAYDEIGNLLEERTWLSLLSCIRSKNKALRKEARASANPGGVGHGWLKRRFIAVCPPDGTIVVDPQTGMTRAFVQAKVYDNPTLIENDPQYVMRLMGLPDVLRKQLLEGDWDAGSGLAFQHLAPLVPRTAIEPWWTLFGAFDWGFGHKFAFGLFANTGDRRVQLVESVMGRRLIPEQIVDRVRETLKARGISFANLQYTVAGADTKIRDEARGAYGPSIAEQFLLHGWSLVNADQSRVTGYQNLLAYTDHTPTKPPLFTMQDTPTNRLVRDQLLEMVTDPDSPNDVLKVNVDPTTGAGGDDAYDMLRYGLMSRPLNVTLPVAPARGVDILQPRRRENATVAPSSAHHWHYRLPSGRTHTETI